MARKDYSRTIRKADAMIAKFGQPKPAKLVRDGVERDCTAVLINYDWRQQGLRDEGAVRFMISTLDPKTHQTLKVPPDHEQDKIIFGGVTYRFMKPDEGLRPGGVILYHDLEGLYDTRGT